MKLDLDNFQVSAAYFYLIFLAESLIKCLPSSYLVDKYEGPFPNDVLKL